MRLASVLSLIFLFTLLTLAQPSWAGKLKEPTAEYSADTHMVTDDVAIDGKVFYSPKKERREQEIGGSREIVIVRLDKKLIWVLIPDQRLYMEHAIEDDGASGDPADLDYEYSFIGKETVNGVKTQKAKITATRKDGVKFTGHMWLTKEWIPVKVDAKATSEDGAESMGIKLELKNIKIEKQPSSLFELPSDYKKIDIDVNEMMKELEGAGKTGAE